MSLKTTTPAKRALTVTGNCPLFLLSLFGLLSPVLSISDLTLSTIDSSRGVKIFGSEANDQTGWSVSSAGDFNNDGIQDILIGAPYADDLPKINVGRAYVIFGHNTQTLATSFPNVDLNTMVSGPTIGFRIVGSQSDYWVGYSVSGGGDVNGDGIDDIIVGIPAAAPSGRTGAGMAVVMFGHRSDYAFADIDPFSVAQLPTSPTTAFRILGAFDGDSAGYAVAIVPDINGDGISDIVISSPDAEANSIGTAGVVNVIFGRNYPAFNFTANIDLLTFSFDSTTGFTIFGANTGYQTGRVLSSAGDVNGDYVNDLMIGAPDASSERGIVYVVYGRATDDYINGVDLSAEDDTVFFSVTGSGVNDGCGTSVAGVGDVNGDDIDDIAIGVYKADNNHGAGSGSVYVIFGTQGAAARSSIALGLFSTSPTTGFRIDGAVASGNAGSSVSLLDINNDGIDDIVIGAPLFGGSVGQLYVVFGRDVFHGDTAFTEIDLLTLTTTGQGFKITGAASGDMTGYSLCALGDVNGDGVDDVVIGAYGASPGRTGAGTTYVVYGQMFTPTSQPSTQPTSRPSRQPTSQPSAQPSAQPSSIPSRQPSVQPSSLPSAQPSTQPSSRPSRQPTSQPSAQPSSQPTRQPTRQPTSQPSSQPSAQPIGVPSSQPSAQPSSLPSAQPSTQPSSRPSRQPTGHPSSQPSSQPTSQPSRQPTSQPSAQPSAQPIGRPSAQPSAQPNARPSGQPTRQPTRQPTGQPSRQPSRQPTGQPSSRPSAHPTVVPPPTTEWVTTLDATATVAGTTAVNGNVWACGSQNSSRSAQCSVVQATGGAFVTKYTFPWESVTSVLVISDTTNAVIGGRRTDRQTGVVTSSAANCLFGTERITCAAMNFQGVSFVGAAYVPFTDQLMYISTYTGQPSVTILDSAISTAVAYTYSVSAMQSTTLYTVHSVANFIGSFVGAVSVSSASVNFIVSGWVRADTGAMNLMYLTPITGNVVSKGSEGLVTCMTVESTGPDSFMAGGLRLNDNTGTNAYLVRSNALYKTVLYAVRYRQTSSSRRRLATSSTTVRTIARGIVLAGDYVYLILDNTRSTSTSNVTMLSVIKSDASSGVIVSQAHVSAPSAQSLKCTDITSTTIGSVTNLYIACGVYSALSTQYIVLASDTLLTFARMPKNFVRTADAKFYTQNVGFYGTNLPSSIQNTYIPTTNSAFNSTGALPAAPTYAPSPYPTMSTMQPSSRPSGVPSAQPSSSPTVAPTVSARPTSQPSTASPTNTPKPSVAPVAKPSAKPTAMPSVRPSAMPTPQPSAAPTVLPSERPTALPTPRPTPMPSAKPSASPKPTTSRPSVRPTTAPSTVAPSATPVPTAVPSEAPSAVPTTQPTTNNQPAVTPVYVYGVAGAGGALILALGVFFLWRYRRDHIERKTQRQIFAKIVPGFGDDATIIPMVMGIQGMDGPMHEEKPSKNAFGLSSSSKSANTLPSAFSSPRHSLVAGGAVDSPKAVANRKRLTSMDSQYSYNISEMSSDDDM